MRTFRLVIACPDRVGIVAKVSNFLASHNGWITEASHHSDNQSGWFFMRHEIRADSLPFGIEAFRKPLRRSPKSSRWTGASPIPSRRSAWC
jgi:formyltetrahydrofolate deformylase